MKNSENIGNNEKILTKGLFYLITVALAILAIMIIFLSKEIISKTKENAYNNLMGSTEVIKQSIELSVEKDFNIIKEYSLNLSSVDEEYIPQSINLFNKTNNFFKTQYVNNTGRKISSNGSIYSTNDFPVKETALSEGEISISEGYRGESGDIQIMFQIPLLKDKKVVGAIYVEVLAHKYYSDKIFTFYDERGRAFILSSESGEWLIKSPVSTLLNTKEDNVYEALEASENSFEIIKNFKETIKEKKKRIFLINYGKTSSYICLSPMENNKNWYMMSMISVDDLQKEVSDVNIILIGIQISLVLGTSLIVLLIWMYLKENHEKHLMKLKTEYDEDLHMREKRLSEISMQEYDFQIVVNLDTMKCNIELYNNFKLYKNIFNDEEYPEEFERYCNENIYSEDIEALKNYLAPDKLLERYKNKDKSIPHINYRLAVEGKDIWIESTIFFSEVDEESFAYIMSKNVTEKIISKVKLEQTNLELENRLSELKRMKDALQLTLNTSEQANLAKSKFLSNMSHDIRTPMNAIIGTSIIANQNLKDPEKISQCLKIIVSSSNHLLNLINDILDMSKIESGKMILNEEEFEFPMLIERVVSIIQPLCTVKNQTFTTELANIEHEYLYGDTVRINQILINLLNNANKFTPDGGKIKLHIEEIESGTNGYAAYRIKVIDNGIGIAPKNINKIFEAFEREIDSKVNKIEGTGLGLTISKSLVQAMDGTIDVESKQGSGTVFTLVLHFKIKEEVDYNKIYKSLKGIKTLIVDSEIEICKSTSQFLNEVGMRADWVLSGKEALPKIIESHEKKDYYYLIIIEWKMSEDDVIETIKSIRKALGSSVPIIILTSYEWREIEKTAREAGVDGFISKPLFKSTLYQKIIEIREKKFEYTSEDIDFTGKVFMIAEDNLINQMIVKNLFENYGAKVDIADNGEIAVEYFKNSVEGHYDAVFMDIQMPVMNGYEASKKIRELSRSDAQIIPIIAMTANVFTEDIERAFNSGMRAHIAKPIDMNRINQVLKEQGVLK